MDASSRRPALRTLIVGVLYFGVGILFGLLAGAAGPNHARVVFWRLAAWLVSAAVYAVHIYYEQFRLSNAPLSTALHAAGAAALGAFALALMATAHSLWTSNYRPAYVVALAAWPAITAVPAFVVALAAGEGLSRIWGKQRE